MIVDYDDFIFVKDEGMIALARKVEGGEPQVIRRVHLGDSLGDMVGSAWTHSDAPPAVVKKVVGK